MQEVEEGAYIVLDGKKVTMEKLGKTNPLFADMILEGSYGDPEEVLGNHREFSSNG